jgi:xylan 1,4-beta-xylosidase
VTHTRVDETHGDAHSVWVSQGSPATPSDAQVAALRRAMDPGLLERERVVGVRNGAVSLSFALPRFGLSLVTLVPSSGPKPESAPSSAAGCSCRLPAPGPTPPVVLLALLLAVALVCRRRRD